MVARTRPGGHHPAGGDGTQLAFARLLSWGDGNTRVFLSQIWEALRLSAARCERGASPFYGGLVGRDPAPRAGWAQPPAISPAGGCLQNELRCLCQWFAAARSPLRSNPRGAAMRDKTSHWRLVVLRGRVVQYSEPQHRCRSALHPAAELYLLRAFRLVS